MNDSDLDQLLRAAGTLLSTPPGFQRDVWCRIETTEIGGWKSRAMHMVERSLGFFALPRVAIATCTAVAMAGAWIGLQTATPSASYEASYVQSISPFAQSHR